MKRSPGRPCRRPGRMTRQRGLTLAEMVVTVAVVGVLAVSIGSAILIAARALPDADNAAGRSLDAALVLDQIAAEVYSAISVSQCSATMIEFTVERGQADHTIRYEWSGRPGDPLTRQYDGGAVVRALEDVQNFALTYHVQMSTETVQQDVVTPERLLVSFTGWPGVKTSPRTWQLNPGHWMAEFFTIDQPTPDAKQLKVTRVFLKLRYLGQADAQTISVGIHRTIAAGNPEPHQSPIGTPDVRPVSYLPGSFEWREFRFSDVAITNPDKEYVIVVKANDGNAELEYLHAKSAPQDPIIALWSKDSGAKWEPSAGGARHDNDVPFHVYGTYLTSEMVEVPSNTLESLGIAIGIGSAPMRTVQTEALALNKPELPAQ